MSTEDTEAVTALDLWRAEQAYSADVDAPFLAGFQAGADWIRQAVLKLWDENDAWIPGADYQRLAAALGIAPQRAQTYRKGGLSRPAQAMRSRNTPVG